MFIRDRLTWLGYLLVGYNCFIAASFGPIMPFMRAELELIYSVAALHFSALACGSLITGTMGDKLMRRFGSPVTLWGGATGILIGAALILAGRWAPVTIFGAMLIGFTGSLMGQTVTAIMSNRFGPQRSIGIYECNIIAAVFCAIAPLTVGVVANLGWNWRVAWVFPAIMFVVLALTNRRTVKGSISAIEEPVLAGPLPRAYWAYFFVVGFSVAAEWSVIFWTSDFLEKVVHLTKADAATAGSVFLTAMFLGRILGSRLTRVLPLRRMLPVAACVAAVGFLIFWLGNSVPVSLFGLMLLGLGEANMYPLTFSAALGVAANQSARATSRMSISTGAAILIAPLILGLIAECSGIYVAYAFVAVLLITATVGVFVANALAARHDEETAAKAATADGLAAVSPSETEAASSASGIAAIPSTAVTSPPTSTQSSSADT